MLAATMAMRMRDQTGHFNELVQTHRGIVFKVANSYCRDPHEREDLTQEICAQLWRAFPKFDDTQTFSTWMYRIALNVAISHLRERSRRERHHEPLDLNVHDRAETDFNPEIDARVNALYRCMDRLDPLNRALLVLYLDERSQRDIAEILGFSETNVATKIGRLKARLRNDMSEE